MSPITTLGISGYRSLRDVRLELGPLTVVTGPNGSGKSSLYRAVRLLADVAQGRVIPSLAQEGGLSSALWAGPETFSRAMRQGIEPVHGTMRRNPVSLRLGVSSDDQGYAIDLGLPPPVPPSRFDRDPEIKMESLWTGRTWRRGAAFAERHGPSVQIRDGRGAWREAAQALAPYDSMLTHCANSSDAIELLQFRESLRAWRFYDHFRTDAAAPARQRQVGTRTAALASDGADIAAAIATIMEVGADADLADAVEDAFPGTSIDVSVGHGAFEIEIRQHGLLRPLHTAELSDGTLRYLLLIAALLTPRPPPLMVFNEPETSLHPDLVLPLARLLVRAATRSQILVISHSQDLVSALVEGDAVAVALAKELGETVVAEQDAPAWIWPSR
ncbi:AAA family ATPase [Lichenicoccus sp.]|uniref:AAA family ATPase n=1 Tax=Lichenicoccus sp. TaxID=2781899 RepID=UPI003D09E98C